ncbi:methionyl-tRNA formyltransferase [Candidatus Neptunochlamydia vexilliferae]|uniref:Methionyl-tRNA formyltransferase n=1 Tax=Candidatus Neptunichlamydia vexilliferae TaxID=1651774 RepID=A0ABS0AXN3_9BACT|nr:methionyl-tRNA formyltransferase [Candidatus Neptunochlamydia vexilliferae]MBF5058886.1 Methionyl-tRNA formyltransferase [Candidatus Neptunochlamydia vexilliferae]
MKIIYFGTPTFASVVLDFLIQSGVEVLAIVTKPDKPRGRSGKPAFSAVKQLATEKYPTIPLYQPDKASTTSFEEEIARYGADLFVVVAYGEIMKQPLLDLPKRGCINLHASLLPKYRGAAPIQFALLDGAKQTGVTIIEMVLKMDAGPMLAQEKIPIPKEMNSGELEEALCDLGGKTLLRVIKTYPKQKVEQDPRGATYVQKITPDMAAIDWGKPAETLHNQIRAFSPRPGAWCEVEIDGQTKRLKIFKAEVSAETEEVFSKEKWSIPCGEGALSLLEVQLEGKKKLPIGDFARGLNQPPHIKK